MPSAIIILCEILIVVAGIYIDRMLMINIGITLNLNKKNF